MQVLDSALLRPGRFDRQVTVDRPDVAGRVKILKVHSRGKQIGKDVDFDKVARRTPGEHPPLLVCIVLRMHPGKRITSVLLHSPLIAVLLGPLNILRLVKHVTFGSKAPITGASIQDLLHVSKHLE